MIAPLAASGPERPRGGYNVAINGLRGLCVLMVFGYHVYNAGLLPKMGSSPLALVTDFCLSSLRYGVEIFFMISGYVIVRSLRRHATVGAFLVDRVLRIFPAWLPVHFALCLGGSLTGVRVFESSGWAIPFFANLVFLPPLLPLPNTHPASWSISYEWLFYFGAAALVVLRRQRSTTSIVLWGLSAALLLLAFPRGLFFLPGVLMALLPRRPDLGRARLAPLALLLFLLAWRGVGQDFASFDGFRMVRAWHTSLWLCPLALLAATYFIGAVCFSNGPTTAALRLRPFQLLGDVSYSFYLWHPVVMFGVKKVVTAVILPHTGPVVATACFAALSFAIALPISVSSRRLCEVRAAAAVRAWLYPRATAAATRVEVI